LRARARKELSQIQLAEFFAEFESCHSDQKSKGEACPLLLIF